MAPNVLELRTFSKVAGDTSAVKLAQSADQMIHPNPIPKHAIPGPYTVPQRNRVNRESLRLKVRHLALKTRYLLTPTSAADFAVADYTAGLLFSPLGRMN